MTVLLPQASDRQIGMSARVRDGETPVLYLLHGMSDDDTIWLRRTSIERYASELGIAVVMPQVHRSFYTDLAHGGQYWEFISDELPALIAQSFRLSQRREDTFVAGLSMGGYGAMKLALNQPTRFAAAGSLSGALDVVQRFTSGKFPELNDVVWGDQSPAGTDNDLIDVLNRADPAALPKLWLTCGTEDHLLAENRHFVATARERNISLEADEQPGAHVWGFWDLHIQRFLAWLPLASK